LDERFHDELRLGKMLEIASIELLRGEGITLAAVIDALRKIFNNIAEKFWPLGGSESNKYSKIYCSLTTPTQTKLSLR
jgi:hypothetical protein